MKSHVLSRILLLIILVVLLPGTGQAGDIPPVVSTDWLISNLNNPRLIILDVRRVEDYREGHIPNSVNTFYGAWAYKKDGFFAEIPEQDDLDDTIGYMGISFHSWVVVTGKMDTPSLSYQSARVACTLQYAGIKNVALLDGGMNKWIAEKKPLSQTIVRTEKRHFRGKYSRAKFADKNYIKSHMGKIILLDVREPEYFTGEKKKVCVPQKGHIPGAFNLPTSCAFNEDKTFKSRDKLAAIAEAVAGKNKSREIITYCDTGQCCPVWSYLFKEVLGYTNVRIYTAGMQEWMQDTRSPAAR